MTTQSKQQQQPSQQPQANGAGIARPATGAVEAGVNADDPVGFVGAACGAGAGAAMVWQPLHRSQRNAG